MALTKVTAQLADIELAAAVDSLRKLEPGFLPYPIFQEIARLVVLPIVELVPVRKGLDGGIEVLLTQRDPDDPFWPGMWHNPGTVVRATDASGDYDGPLKRIWQDELGLAQAPEVHFVDGFLHRTRRGSESTRVYWAELLDRPKNGTFFAAAALPANTIKSHIKIIQAAASTYRDSVSGRLARPAVLGPRVRRRRPAAVRIAAPVGPARRGPRRSRPGRRPAPGRAPTSGSPPGRPAPRGPGRRR
jgi:hypothetical protein